jgi:UDP-glucuronate 4-epimerase
MNDLRKKVVITGAAGFIGFHLSKMLLESGADVLGLDCLSDYYDVNLKKDRIRILNGFGTFKFLKLNLVNETDTLLAEVETFKPDAIFHLAAQAGVRHSIDVPEAYLSNNIVATFNVLEVSKRVKIKHLIIASTSSVYGANTNMPFNEEQVTDTPLSFYAATKKSCESMGHAYANIYGIPITMCRFFTVYGPWGRPDMALFKFTKNIINRVPIEVYNHGQMSRDFTYVSDVASSLMRLIDLSPLAHTVSQGDRTSSAVAPYRVLNIGNSQPTGLMAFITAIESELGIKAEMEFRDMQPGDVSSTFADASALYELSGFKPNTSVAAGVKEFVSWFRQYYEL